MKKGMIVKISFEQLAEIIDTTGVKDFDGKIMDAESISIWTDQQREMIMVKIRHPDGIQVPEASEYPMKELDFHGE